MSSSTPRLVGLLLAVTLWALPSPQVQARQQQQDPAQDTQAFRFRSAVELINVTATVTDASGRFVSGLRKEDFEVYDNELPQAITHFSSERVPVSLGIVVDTSGSMDGVKIAAARSALDRFLFELLGPEDEVFLYRFDSDPELVQGWTTDRRRVSEALSKLRPSGGTALYDAVAAAVPLARTGRHRKKALVVISDGNDTSSHIEVSALQGMIRESEILVYAIGIDAQPETLTPWSGRDEQGLLQLASAGGQRQRPRPLPFPIPGGRRRPGQPPGYPSPLPPRGPIMPPRYPTPPPIPPGNTASRNAASDRVNVAALRDITDDSGGRTEIIRAAYDLGPATAGIADELSKQYYLGYPAAGEKDGRWHTIRVEVNRGHYRVRARRGYMAVQ